MGENILEDNKNKFIRWHKITLEERGKSINLFLGMLLATVGFLINTISKNDFEFHSICSENFLIWGTVGCLVSILFFVIVTLNRLKDFRQTTEIARLTEILETKDMDKLRLKNKVTGTYTHILHIIALITFAFGELTVVIGFILQLADKI